MAITLVGVGAQAASATASATLTAAYPAGYTAVADDFAVFICLGKPAANSTGVPTAPTGYTQQASQDRANQTLRIVVYTKKLTASEAAPQITVPATDSWSNLTTVQLAVYRGVDTTTPLDVAVVTASAAAATTWAPTGITTVTNGAWVLSMVGTSDDNALALLAGSEQGFTAEMSGASYDTTTGTDAAVGLADKEITTAGAVTCPTWNETLVGTDPWVGVTMALRPASTGTTLTPGAGQLTLSGFAPTLVTQITPGVGQLTLSGFAPTLVNVVQITPGAGQLTLSGFAPSLVNVTVVTPGAGQLSLAGFAPVLNTQITPGAGQITLTGFSPALKSIITPGAGQLSLAGFAPSLRTIITPGAGQLTLTGFAPTLRAVTQIVPGTGVMPLTGFAPSFVTAVATTRRGKGGIRFIDLGDETPEKPLERPEPPRPAPEARPLPEVPAAPRPRAERAPLRAIRAELEIDTTDLTEEDEEDLLFILAHLI